MKKLTYIILIAISFSLSPNTQARDKSSAMVTGYGNQLCSTMTEDVKNSSADGYYKEYINGVGSGVNLAVFGKPDYLEGLDTTAKYKFVLKYCEDNPIDTVIKAISKLYERVNGVGIGLLNGPIPTSTNASQKKQ